MKKKLQLFMAGAVMLLGLGLANTAILNQPVGATTGNTGTNSDECDPKAKGLAGHKCARGDDQSRELFGKDGIMTTVINFLLFFIGVISVIMIIYGGIQYSTSAGDSGKVTNAKNTILYAVVGLIVAILAYAIVNFVIESFTAKKTEETPASVIKVIDLR